MIQFSVSDSGIGIKQEDQIKLFELFGKLKNTEDINTHGIGLGLNICKKLVESFGGSIWVKSQYMVGTTFSFTLPLESSPQDETRFLASSNFHENNLNNTVKVEESKTNNIYTDTLDNVCEESAFYSQIESRLQQLDTVRLDEIKISQVFN